ncbi:hypothetical protein VSS37_21440 [Candidatus Thiothrix sp. Deng01]|uniref:ATP-binding protein n=1 Tax=Candidatus Thiothrix phosphatis TaxID=3112415 RepID=A0ABU6D429_9GAMM|nr:hypothetical protein [Candidatus Thiothrix sp. Deng01]MEB4593556.1 hypothetical protein [Candidatus Thiothrix sp. Deng01]
MSGLSEQIRLRAGYTRSVNLQRDVGNLELVKAYLPTAKSLQALEQVTDSLSDAPADRALALIGPYGSGKSAFALFLSALLAGNDDPLRQAALTVLAQHDHAKALLPHFKQPAVGERGFLRVVVNGIPTSLSKQLLAAFAHAMEQQGMDKAFQRKVLTAAQDATPPTMDRVIALIEEIQLEWAILGGAGVLLEIDELGKFLEYEAYHPQNREIHLLQLLAEHAHQGGDAPLHIVVMLHQSFEHYTQRLGKHLRDEWQKIQGRFNTLAFLEPAEQALRIVAAAFDGHCPLPAATQTQLDIWATVLAEEGALPHGMDKPNAQALFAQCYPLHPLTTLILPTLCQKVAQNERTLFSYLGSQEPFGLRHRLAQLHVGEWVMPADLYDYFMLNHPGGFSDPLTYHRWVEVVTALERFDAAPNDPAVGLLKVIGLLNLVGSQRGLKASQPILQLAFGESLPQHSQRLLDASIIHFRSFNQEYRVWQGSDFDLAGSLRQARVEFENLPLADKLNALAPFKSVVARRATIEKGTLRSFSPYFASHLTRNKAKLGQTSPRIVFYLAEEGEVLPDMNTFGQYDVVAVCHSTERLREAVITQLALQELPKHHAALHQDPVAQREYRDWLHNAEIETSKRLRSFLEEPESLQWSANGKAWTVLNRRSLQGQLSTWMKESCYPKAPLIRNELANWDKPSPSANTGRKRLINAMLTSADQPYLGIEKTPAEMSLYLSLLYATELHRQEKGRWGFHAPAPEDVLDNGKLLFQIPNSLQPMWEAITQLLGNAGARQVPLTEIYNALRQPPFGIKLGVLPVILVAYFLAYRREVALYQEGVFSDDMSLAQAELLCRRPELFALERFELKGVRGDLFDQYMGTVVGKVREDASLLDIVGPLVRFVSNLPPYTMRCSGLSADAERVRKVFAQAKSPGALLFNELPQACGLAVDAFESGDAVLVESFIQRLVAVLRELNAAYGTLLEHWQAQLNQVLLDGAMPDLPSLRAELAKRYAGLDKYATDQKGVGAFIRRLGDSGYDSDQAWLESIATLVEGVPPKKWADENRLQAGLRLEERGQQLRDLIKLRLAVPNADNAQGTVLIRWVDTTHGERSRVVQLSDSQRKAVEKRVGEIAKGLDGLNESEQLAIIASLLGRLSQKEQMEEVQS